MEVKEVIVVEGKCDTLAIRRAVPTAQTIETNGSALSKETLDLIEKAAFTRGVIVFTDPDYPGRRIRALIEERVPTVKHAFLTKEETISHRTKYKSIGIEHASPEAIREALEAVYTVSEPTEEVSQVTLVELGLIGHPDARERREQLAERLKIGYVNGKGLKKRLAMFRITEEEVRLAMNEVEENEK